VTPFFGTGPGKENHDDTKDDCSLSLTCGY
jgi:hypothetical protein